MANTVKDISGERVESVDKDVVRTITFEPVDDQNPIEGHGLLELSIHNFYHYTLRLLARQLRCLKCPSCIRGHVRSSLERDLGSLYMWAQGLDLRFLQNGIDHNTGLQEAVVRELTGVAYLTATFSSDIFTERARIGHQIAEIIEHFTSVASDSEGDSDDSSIAVRKNLEIMDTDQVVNQDALHMGHQKASYSLRLHVRGLLDLTPTIEHCSLEERSRLALNGATDSSRHAIIDQAVRPYVMQIQDKFPSINEVLAKKLGEANRSRSQKLLLLSSQLPRKSSEVEDINDLGDDEDFDEVAAAAVTFQPMSEFHDSGIGLSLISGSPYNPSVASHKSFLSTTSAASRGSVRVPPTPAAVEQGIPFSCPICGVTLSKIRNRIDWKLHVFADIQAYVCTSDDCKDTKVTFPIRKLWAEHEFQNHRAETVWRCCHCQFDHDSSGDLVNHLQHKHSYQLTDTSPEMVAMVHAAKTSMVKIANQACPMCLKTKFTDQHDWATHVGRHLEEIALIVLPRAVESDDEDDAQSTQSEPGSELDARNAKKSEDNEHYNEHDTSTVELIMPKFTENMTPTLDGFIQHVCWLNPRLEASLADRIAADCLRTYQRLLQARISHKMQADNQNSCPSGAFCNDLGGKPKILSVKSFRESPNIKYNQYQTSTGLQPEVAEGVGSGSEVVRQELFPSGIPLPPVSHLPAEFECNLCFQVKKISKPSDWTKHVHEDVQPFSCTFVSCSEPKSFKRKADWIQHENECHRHLEYWKCTLEDCRHICSRMDNFIAHLVREHKMTEPKALRRVGKTTPEDQKFLRTMEMCRISAAIKPQDEPCPFCGWTSSTWKKRAVHVGNHFEQITMPIIDLVDKYAIPGDELDMFSLTE